MAKRRDRGSVVEWGNGWRVRVSAGTDPVTGKRLWLCGTCGSKLEAERLRPGVVAAPGFGCSPPQLAADPKR